MCITVYGSQYDETEEESLPELKSELLEIFANTTFVDKVEPEFASTHTFDSIAFDCGWYATDLENVYWREGGINLYDDIDIHNWSEVEKILNSGN